MNFRAIITGRNDSCPLGGRIPRRGLFQFSRLSPEHEDKAEDKAEDKCRWADYFAAIGSGLDKNWAAGNELPLGPLGGL